LPGAVGLDGSIALADTPRPSGLAPGAGRRRRGDQPADRQCHSQSSNDVLLHSPRLRIAAAKEASAGVGGVCRVSRNGTQLRGRLQPGAPKVVGATDIRASGALGHAAAQLMERLGLLRVDVRWWVAHCGVSTKWWLVSAHQVAVGLASRPGAALEIRHAALPHAARGDGVVAHPCHWVRRPSRVYASRARRGCGGDQAARHQHAGQSSDDVLLHGMKLPLV
jgi:hypothetical protein